MQRKELERKEGFESIVPVNRIKSGHSRPNKNSPQAVTSCSFTLGLTFMSKQTFRKKLYVVKNGGNLFCTDVHTGI
jgi:hypothetical protein